LNAGLGVAAVVAVAVLVVVSRVERDGQADRGVRGGPRFEGQVAAVQEAHARRHRSVFEGLDLGLLADQRCVRALCRGRAAPAFATRGPIKKGMEEA